MPLFFLRKKTTMKNSLESKNNPGPSAPLKTCIANVATTESSSIKPQQLQRPPAVDPWSLAFCPRLGALFLRQPGTARVFDLFRCDD